MSLKEGSNAGLESDADSRIVTRRNAIGLRRTNTDPEDLVDYRADRLDRVDEDIDGQVLQLQTVRIHGGHPDTLVPGGPEIDFGVQTDDLFLLGEAKWRSSVGAAQGVNRDKDQVTLRREFCEKYGPRLLPIVKHFVVLGASWKGGITTQAQSESSGVLHLADLVLIGITAAIGFTVSLFFATAAFPAGAALAETKMGALLSFSAAPLALIASRLLRRRAASDIAAVARS